MGRIMMTPDYIASAVEEIGQFRRKGAEFLGVHFVFKRAGFCPSRTRGLVFLAIFLKLKFRGLIS